MNRKYLTRIFLVILLALKSNVVMAETAKKVSMPIDFFPVQEYELKAVFLYNLGHFVSWPPKSMNNGYFLICVLGKDPFQNSLDLATNGKQLHNQSVKLRYLKRVEEGLDCQVVFISSSEEPFISSIVSTLEKYPILTVSDTHNFLNEGGMIRFAIQDGKVKLHINKTNIKKVNLNISARLLAVAEVFK